MCEKCQDTGVRPLTEEEIEEADLDGYDPEDTMIITETYCECEIGQRRLDEFRNTWFALLERHFLEGNANGEPKGMRHYEEDGQ